MDAYQSHDDCIPQTVFEPWFSHTQNKLSFSLWFWSDSLVRGVGIHPDLSKMKNTMLM